MRFGWFASAELGAILAEDDIPLHCDAVQAPCAMTVSGLANHANLISLSGRKIFGPQGIGALFVRHTLLVRMSPLIHGGGQQNGLRSGTVPVPLCVGMATATRLLRGEN
ncbi:MAG: aminotransferase class V-fold PLP-dependent enzyme, partial [Thiotrichales bacterium]|nr:aminotransferase class V-fold PLP-dependent enzyme [Thiotrichales bacterium]